MSTLAIQHHIADVLVPLGMAGAVIAVVSALVAAGAFALHAAGFGGIASASWVVGVILSAAAGYGGLWAPLAVAVGPAVVAAIAVGIRRALAVRPGLPSLPSLDTATTPVPA